MYAMRGSQSSGRCGVSKIYHRAHLIGENGEVSALCFSKPKPINLAKALWTLRDKAVSCPRCKAVMEKGGKL